MMTAKKPKPSLRQWEVLRHYIVGDQVGIRVASVLACLDRGWLECDRDSYPPLYRVTDEGRSVYAQGAPVPDPWTQAANAGREHQRHLRAMVTKWGLGTTAIITDRTVVGLQEAIAKDWGAWAREERARAAQKNPNT